MTKAQSQTIQTIVIWCRKKYNNDNHQRSSQVCIWMYYVTWNEQVLSVRLVLFLLFVHWILVLVFGWIWFGFRRRWTFFKIHCNRLITLFLGLECVHNVPAMLHMFESFKPNSHPLLHFMKAWVSSIPFFAPTLHTRCFNNNNKNFVDANVRRHTNGVD